MFASPVVYPLSAVPQRIQTLYMLNPMAGIVDSFRRIVVQGVPPAVAPLVMAAVVALVVLPLSYMYFKHVESTLADVI
jgi:lipopolysaccharide transport system permease protein